MKNSQHKNLTVVCDAGLCNRIFVLVTGYVIAEATKRNFKMLWPLSPGCGASYKELFSNELCVQDVQDFSIDNFQRYDGMFKQAPNLLFENATDISLVSYQFLINPSYYSHHDELISRCFGVMNSLKPVPEIMNKVHQFTQNNFHTKMIGVHLRRGDFEIYNPEGFGNTSQALTQTEKFLKTFPDAGIFLCSDDNIWAIKNSNSLTSTSGNSVLDLFKLRFGDRVCYRAPTSLDRESSQAIKDALIDLWLLRQTDIVVGTYGSTFSKLAAWGRNVPVVYCRERNLPHEIERIFWKFSGLGLLLRTLAYPEANKNLDSIIMRKRYHNRLLQKIDKSKVRFKKMVRKIIM